MIGTTWRTTHPLPHVLPALRGAYGRVEQGACNWFFTLASLYNGVGKTHLLAVMANAGAARGYPAHYTTAAALLDGLRAAYDDNSFHRVWGYLTEVRLLLVDEVLRVAGSEWANERLQELLGHRYLYGERLFTGLAYNGRLSDLPPYYQSRVLDTRCLAYQIGDGPDLRRLAR